MRQRRLFFLLLICLQYFSARPFYTSNLNSSGFSVLMTNFLLSVKKKKLLDFPDPSEKL